MTKTFVIGTVDNRISSLLNMLVSAKRYIGPWEFVIVAQHYTPEQMAFVVDRCRTLFGEQIFHMHFEFMTDYMGCFRSKMYGLKKYDSDIYLSMDDDMLILPQTDYDRMAEVYMEHRELGMLAGHYCWRRESVKNATVKDKLKTQPLVGTYGGLMFGRELRDLFIAEMDGHDVLFDDLGWALTSYTHGYIQGIYYGSLIIHMIGSSGGFKKWFKDDKHELPDPTLINIQHRKNDLTNENAVVFMGSEDLTQKAHDLHNQNKRLRNEVTT